MNASALVRIRSYGQSVWLDYLDRGLIDSGALRRLIKDDAISGVTTNPAIFEKSIDGTDYYDEAIAALASQGASPLTIYRHLTVRDVMDAAALLGPTFEASNGTDGFVSLEVSPHLAHDTEGTIREARELWAALDRPNVLIKVPATPAGLPAIRKLLAEGVNVNVTLLFGLGRYREIVQTYLSALEDRVKFNHPVDRVASVASFFLSRIDTLVDAQLKRIAEQSEQLAVEARQLQGQTAIACAKVAYAQYQTVFSSQRFEHLRQHGARTQRLLWASTSTKNPAYSDTKYVEPLIGTGTVNTMPLETLEAYRDHGSPAARLKEKNDDSDAVLARLAGIGVDLSHIAVQLEGEGVQKFIAPYDELLASIEKKVRARASAREAVRR
jgi:transaldolase